MCSNNPKIAKKSSARLPSKGK